MGQEVRWEVHTVETAPQEGADAVARSVARYGFLPNLHGIMVEAPGLLRAYHAVQDEFEGSSLTRQEQQIIALAVSVENRCHYCVAGHTMLAQLAKLPPDEVAALRDEAPMRSDRWEALRRFAQTMVRQRGWVEPAEVEAFIAAGFTKRNVLEVIVGIAYKTMSNFTNHLAHTPLDEAVTEFAWEAPTTTTR